jgi:hypothetical protein
MRDAFPLSTWTIHGPLMLPEEINNGSRSNRPEGISLRREEISKPVAQQWCSTLLVAFVLAPKKCCSLELMVDYNSHLVSYF